MRRKEDDGSGPADLDDEPRDQWGRPIPKPQPRLTDEELIFFRKEKRRAENISWLWQQLRPWAIPLGTALATAAGWLVTHINFTSGK